MNDENREIDEQSIPAQVLARIDKAINELMEQKLKVWPPFPYSFWNTDRVFFIAREAALSEYLHSQPLPVLPWLKELIEMAEDGYKLHRSNAVHQEFLAEDRDTLWDAKLYLAELTRPTPAPEVKQEQAELEEYRFKEGELTKLLYDYQHKYGEGVGGYEFFKEGYRLGRSTSTEQPSVVPDAASKEFSPGDIFIKWAIEQVRMKEVYDQFEFANDATNFGTMRPYIVNKINKIFKELSAPNPTDSQQDQEQVK